MTMKHAAAEDASSCWNYGFQVCSCLGHGKDPPKSWRIHVERLLSAPEIVSTLVAGLPCNICLWCVAAEPRHNVYPAVVGAAIGGMLFAAIVTVLLLVFIIRNRHNNPRKSERAFIGLLKDLAFILCFSPTRASWYAVWFVSICVAPETIAIYSLYWCSLGSYTPRTISPPFAASRQHSQSRENINFPEDETVGASEGQTGDSGGGKTIPVQTLFSFSCTSKKKKEEKSSYALSDLCWCFPSRSHSGFTPGFFASHHRPQECHSHQQPSPSL